MGAPAIGLTDKQLAMRATGVGASEVFDVINGGIVTYARKVGEAAEFEGNSLTEFGARIERVIGEAWSDRHPGLRIYTPGTLRHPQHDWALATLDRVVAPPGLGRPARLQWVEGLEIKVSFFSDDQYGEGAEDVPEKYLTQVQWQMEVAGLDQVSLVALVRGDYREYPIQRDREMGGLLLEVVGQFWRDHVLARVPPPVDGTKAYTEFLRRRHPTDKAPPLPATAELRDLVARLREAKAAVKAAEGAEQLLDNQLRATIGDAAGIEDLCTYHSNKPSTKTDWEAFAAACNRSDLLPKFTTTKPGARVLRLAKEK